MLSLACSKETTWSSIDITSAFLNADIHDDDTALVTPPPILVKMDIVKPNTVWHVKKAIYGLREAPRLWQQERDQKLRDLEFKYQDKLAHLIHSYIHPSLWFIAEGPRESTLGIPPFDHCLRSDEWTARLHKHNILGYVGVYVDDLLIARPRYGQVTSGVSPNTGGRLEVCIMLAINTGLEVMSGSTEKGVP